VIDDDDDDDDIVQWGLLLCLGGGTSHIMISISIHLSIEQTDAIQPK
jgi:hypothetical protein